VGPTGEQVYDTYYLVNLIIKSNRISKFKHFGFLVKVVSLNKR